VIAALFSNYEKCRIAREKLWGIEEINEIYKKLLKGIVA